MRTTLIKNATIVNEGRVFNGSVLIEGSVIKEVFEADHPTLSENITIIDASGLYLIPGMIDDQVHFREPGLTHKAEIATEARAAVAGGITSFMEMPNTNPQTITQRELEKKYARAAACSVANYSFYMGATNNNLDQVLATDVNNVCGVKIFMGSSTGNMLVDNQEALDKIFKNCRMLIATHCEDEMTIRNNAALYKERYGDDVPIHAHPLIRSEEACYLSSSRAVDLAKKHDTRLHILHISTAKECNLFDNTTPLEDKRITAEACIHHLWFTDADYAHKGTHIKWNPAVKTELDRAGIWAALLDNRIDVIATDHAPHTKEEKAGNYWSAPSGGPLVQDALLALLECVKQGKITIERVVEKSAHAVAKCYQLKDRGYIRAGYKADLVLIDPNDDTVRNAENVLSKCGWSPFEGTTFHHKIHSTFVNGQRVYDGAEVNNNIRGEQLTFSR